MAQARFNFNGNTYLSPSFKEADRFLKFWESSAKVTELRSTWIITQIERGPGYGIKAVDLSKVEYGKT